MVQRLGGLDATFLYLETATQHMHVVGVLLLDPSGMDGAPFDAIRNVIADRIHLMAPMRRKLVDVPLHLDHPVWIEDPDFDLENHMFHVGVREPGDLRALSEMVGEIASRPLDRTKPLWELWVADGLEDGRVALISKMHHASVDGGSGQDLMVHMFDLSPEVEPPAEPPPAAFTGEQPPSDLRLLAGALLNQARTPVKLVRQLGSTAKAAVDTGRALLRRRGAEVPTATPFDAPRTPFSGALTPHRSVAFGKADLDDIKAIKDAFGGKVNDVVLAVTAHALRGWLEDHDALPDEPLVASCPISVHSDDNEAANQLSAMLVSLPVHLEDPAEQLRFVIDATQASKELANAIGAETLMDWAQFLAPRLFTTAMRLYSSFKLADYHRPIQNLIVSNVPGPPVPLYVAGGRVEAIYPFGPLLPGAGINVTVLSNMGNVDFGVIACREHVPDLWSLADRFAEGVRVLVKAAEELDS